jgi:tellurite resistance protein
MQLAELSFTEAKRRAAARGLWTIATIDGVHADEARLISRYLLSLAPDEPVEELAAIEPDELASILTGPGEAAWFIQFGLTLAWSDGSVTDPEREVLRRFAKAFGYAPGDIERIDQEVDDRIAAHPFAGALPDAVRSGAAAAYAEFQRRRNGALDFARRRLETREAWFERFERELVRWNGPVDLETFERFYRARTDDPKLSPQVLYLLLVLKINRAEVYGVGFTIARMDEQFVAPDPNTLYLYVTIEETYHTRILQAMLRTFGIERELEPPMLAARALSGAMGRLPHGIVLPLIMAAEALGCVAFRLLHEVTPRLFGEQPEVVARLQTLLGEILCDEIGHVAWCRAQIGRLGVRAARLLVPVVTSGFLVDVQECAHLFGVERVRAELAAFDLPAMRSRCTQAPFWLPAEL